MVPPPIEKMVRDSFGPLPTLKKPPSLAVLLGKRSSKAAAAASNGLSFTILFCWRPKDQRSLTLAFCVFYRGRVYVCSSFAIQKPRKKGFFFSLLRLESPAACAPTMQERPAFERVVGTGLDSAFDRSVRSLEGKEKKRGRVRSIDPNVGGGKNRGMRNQRIITKKTQKH